MPKYTTAQINRAVDLVKRGRSRTEASRIVGMSIGAVRHHALTAGIVADQVKRGHRHAFRPGARPFTDRDDASILSLRDEGKSFAAIGKALGRNPSSIRYRILTIEQIALRGEETSDA